MTFRDVYRDPRLTSLDRLVVKFLESRADAETGECWHACRTIAAAVCRSIRTVQLSLAHLIEIGFVRRMRDLSIRTRRKFILAWRAARDFFSPRETTPPAPNSVGAIPCAEDHPPTPNSVGAIPCAESAQSLALTIVPPLCTPLEAVSEDFFVRSLETSRTVSSPQPGTDGTGRDGTIDSTTESDPFSWPDPDPEVPVSDVEPAADALAEAIADAERRTQDPDPILAGIGRAMLAILHRDGLAELPARVFAPLPATIHAGLTDRPLPAAPAPSGRDESVPLAPILAAVREERHRGDPAAVVAALMGRWREADNPATRDFFAAAVARLAPGELEGLIVDADRRDIKRPGHRFARQAARALQARASPSPARASGLGPGRGGPS